MRARQGMEFWQEYLQAHRKDLHSAELETVRVSEKSDDGDDGQRRGAAKRRGHRKCQSIGFLPDSDAFCRDTRCSFTREALRRSWVDITLSPVVKNCISHNMARNSTAILRTTFHSLSLPCRWVPLLHLRLLCQHLHRRILWTSRKIHQQWGVMENPLAWISRNRKHK